MNFTQSVGETTASTHSKPPQPAMRSDDENLFVSPSSCFFFVLPSHFVIVVQTFLANPPTCSFPFLSFPRPLPLPFVCRSLERSDTYPFSHFLCSASRACDLAFATVSSACLMMTAAALFASLRVAFAAKKHISNSFWLDFCVASALSSA